jgi:hypothetical protein
MTTEIIIYLLGYYQRFLKSLWEREGYSEDGPIFGVFNKNFLQGGYTRNPHYQKPHSFQQQNILLSE